MSAPWIERPAFRFAFPGRILDAGERPLVMGILNVTPDSFSDGNRYFGIGQAVERAETMAAEGADIIDVGGESTRPGSNGVSADEELRRVLPVVSELAGKLGLPVSIDTQKAAVARAALDAGAVMVNDVSALRTDPEMAAAVSDAGCYVCLMHMLGTPRDMQRNPQYNGDVVAVIKSWLDERAGWAAGQGIKRERIIIDPGIGFGKKPEHNLELIKRINEFHGLNLPVLVGYSRKSTIGMVLDKPVGQRLYGSLAVGVACMMAGVHILRVHDVKPTVDAVRICEAVRQGICYSTS